MIRLDLDALAVPPPGVRLSTRAEVVLPLAAPFVLDGRTYDALTFRPANQHDLRKLRRGGDDVARWLGAVARMTNVSPAVVNALSEADASRAVRVAGAQLMRFMQ